LVKNIKELNIDYTSINAVWVDLLKKIFVPDSERITMENIISKGFFKVFD